MCSAGVTVVVVYVIYYPMGIVLLFKIIKINNVWLRRCVWFVIAWRPSGLCSNRFTSAFILHLHVGGQRLKCEYTLLVPRRLLILLFYLISHDLSIDFTCLTLVS